MLRLHPLRTLLALVATSYTIHASHLRRQLSSGGHEQQLIEFGSLEFYIFALISFGLSCFAGVCSGLTVGYMSISKSEMELWAASDEPDKVRLARPILEILNDHHFLLSTLLLSNALALEALPIFLDKIVPSYMAIFISTAAVVIFGEVLPQAYCTGKNKTTIGYWLAPFVKFLQFIFYPFVKPIVIILDKLIDHDEGKIVLDLEKLKNVLLLHNKKEYGYRPEEIEILQNCLDLRQFQVKKAMIPLDKVFMVEANQKINEDLLSSMTTQNFAKIPVYQGSRDKIIGFIKTKNLIQFDMSNPTTLNESGIIVASVQVNSNSTLLDAVDLLKSKKINFAIVTDEHQRAIGIVTLKQIFQKIVLKKFKDEDIRVQIHLNKQVRIDSVMEAREQD